MSDGSTVRPDALLQTGRRRRLFLALWPDEVLRRRLRELLDRQLPCRSGRPEPIANLHITLVFIGDIASERMAAIEQAAGAVSGTSFELSLARVGYWERPRILWLGPDETPATLFYLVRDLRAALESCGVVSETRPYLPHMTLARKVTRPPPETRVEPVRWPVETFSLVESVPTAGRSLYRELVRWPLPEADKTREPAPLSD
mgnify:CR=1 FL=1